MKRKHDDLLIYGGLVVIALELVALTSCGTLRGAHAQTADAPVEIVIEQETTAPKTEPETTAAPETTEAQPIRNVYQQIWDRSTDEEHDLVARILALEAQGEPYAGERAVVEVILNRVASPEWPDTIRGVLSQKGQFATWKYLGKPYNVPEAEEYRVIEDTLAEGPSILPDNYVYFATSRVNGRGFIQIQHHYFSH